jgi:DNA modification methylase
VEPYYADDLVTLYLGDCREVTAWLAADVLVTDPPYGRAWKHGGDLKAREGGGHSPGHSRPGRDGIAGDRDTAIRDQALAMWGARLAVAFGDLTLPPPAGNKLTLVYRKPSDAGVRGAINGFRRDAEAIYLIGPWPSGLGGRSSVIASGAAKQGGAYACGGRYGHPHAKPVDVMETLIAACPAGAIADPFAGAGSTLVAARNLGRKVIGVELEEQYCERAARRLSQMTLDLPA